MFLGVAIWTMMRNPPYEDTIRKIGEMGFKGVELIGWGQEAFDDYYTPQRCCELKQLIGNLGMKVTNFNHNALGMSSMNSDRRIQAERTFQCAIHTAESLGCECVTTTSPYPFGWLPDQFPKVVDIQKMPRLCVNADLNQNWNENYSVFVEEVRKYARRAREAGLKLLIETHPHRWICSTDALMRLADHVCEDNLGFNMDPSHLFHCGELPQCSIYRAGDLIQHLHISDNDSNTNAHWQPGQGKMDWDAMMQALKNIGYNGELSIELEDVPGCAGRDKLATEEMLNQLKQSAGFMEDVCARNGIVLEKR